MRKFMILIAAVAAACLVAGPGHAKQVQVKLTSQQVTTTCGGYIVHTSSHYGCKKPCGDGKICGFSCDKGGKNCRGVVVQKAAPTGGSKPGSGSPLQGGILNDSAAIMGATGPAQAGRPAAAPAAAAPAFR
jgi:hypothetical protein